MNNDLRGNEQIIRGISLKTINKDAKYCLFRYDPEHFDYELINNIYQSIKEKIDKILIPIPKNTCLEFVEENDLKRIRNRINEILKKKEMEDENE